MAEHVEPWRKKIAKSFNHGALGVGLFLAGVGFSANTCYELEDHDWDLTTSIHREEVLGNFNQAKTELLAIKKSNDIIDRKFDQASLASSSWADTDYRKLRAERSDNTANLEYRTTEFIKTLLRSKDIHEQDAANIITDFNKDGLGGFSKIKIVDADKMRSLNEIRTKYGSDYASFSLSQYKDIMDGGFVDDGEKYFLGAIGILMGSVVSGLSFLLLYSTGIPEKWEKLPDVPKKDRPKKLKKNKRLEN